MEAPVHYESSVRVDAPAESVWAVLVDAAGWSQWESGVIDVDGRLALGEKITIRSAAAPGRSFPVRVTAMQPEALVELTGGMPLGLFKGVRRYRLTRDADQTVLAVREDYSGPLLPLISRSMPDLQPSFDQFTTGLKQRVEGR
jgi:hypothetical protein